MEKTTLKVLRLLLPGVFLWLIVFSILLIEMDSKVIVDFHRDFYFIWILPAIYLFGSIIYSFEVRHEYHTKFLDQTDENIKTKFLEMFKSESHIQDQSDFLKEGHKMVQVFYSLVDNDKSLTIKSKDIFLNGLFWSFSVNAAIFSALGFYVYLFALYFYSNSIYASLVVVSTFTFYISKYIFMPLVTYRHIQRSNDQIEFISVNLKNDLQKKLTSLL